MRSRRIPWLLASSSALTVALALDPATVMDLVGPEGPRGLRTAQAAPGGVGLTILGGA